MSELIPVKLSDIANIVTGSTPPSSQPDSWGEALDFITPSDQSDTYREATPSRFLSAEGAKRLHKRIVPARSTNLTCIGSTIGKVSMAMRDAVTNQQINSIVAKREVAHPEFVYYLIKNWSGDLKQHASGSATPIINKSTLSNYEFLVPDLTGQKAIAEVLGALDDKIAANTKMGHTLEAFGSAQFNRLGLDVEPPDEGILLDDLFDLNPRRTVVSDSPTLIDMKALPTDRPLVEEWTIGAKKGGTRFKNGDTLVARITPCLENRKTAFVDFLDDTEIGIGSTEFIVMRSKDDLPLGVSYFMAISERFRDFAIQNMVGTSGRQRVAAADLARHTLSPVDASELQEFGKWADDGLEFLGSLRQENRTLAAIRDALLPHLMSGKLRVKDAEKVLEDAL